MIVFVYCLPCCSALEQNMPDLHLRALNPLASLQRHIARKAYPELDSRPFPTPDPAIAGLLQANADAIAEEYHRAMHLQVDAPNPDQVENGYWGNLVLVDGGRPVEAGIAACPRTWSVVKQCPLPLGVRGNVFFSALVPGTRIRAHFGPTNMKWRYHLCLTAAEGARIRCGREWREWRQGRCILLDDSFAHEVVHAGDRARVVLIVDCWHPDLSGGEQTFLRDLHVHCDMTPR